MIPRRPVFRGTRALGSIHKTLSPRPAPREESVKASTASPSQLKILKQAVDEYCRDCSIVDDDERLYVAELVSLVFETGAANLNDLRRD